MSGEMQKASGSPRGGNRREVGWFSARRKHEAVERLIRGEALDLVSRELEGPPPR